MEWARAHPEGPQRAGHDDALARLGLVAAAAVDAFGAYGARWASRVTDALTSIVNGHPNRDINQLLPWAYRAQALKAVA
ncbi:hypothetical protein GGD66_006977 [Bradyrhizobium sp. CIR48]|uniref:hypothetical protein n=1 Tax=Bradyrhizobium sp. CIR48 TaxID=2663840 RepID=UPI0016062F2F|nr:hypothetical protein [Bradyrhizobium sp. CIR48]MBB4428390.1 hypothetical protein [Bradyrhizobium sp. CIR48]